MIIEMTSRFTGKTNQMDLNITPDQIERWQAGELIQNAMPNLSIEEREFLMTGTTPEEWKAVFGDEDDE
jgi:hypothetical protein